MNCIDALNTISDKAFDLAIVDPPYGIDDKLANRWGGAEGARIFRGEYYGKRWDIKPSKDYWNHLFRVSRNQIICGANYFELPCTRGIVFWDKDQPLENFSQFELIWTSFDRPARKITIRFEQTKIHPTQKPVRLYEWLLKTYAKKGDKILDTHLGSGSIALACHNLSFDLTGYEIDKDYYESAFNRLEEHRKQQRLFA